MDYIFNRLTDIALCRLYKFILNRTIGKYLNEHFLIDQLQVISREGIVKLKNIQFNVDVINQEFLMEAPIKMVSLNIMELEVHVAYNTLLTESCRFVVNQADVVFEPNRVVPPRQSSKTDSFDSSKVESDTETEDVSEESQRGLSFIAHWIEIVVARLQVTLNGLTVLFRNNSPEASSLQLRIATTQFFNTDPSSFGADQSALNMSSHMAQSGLASTASGHLKLGKKKIVTVDGLKVELVSGGSEGSPRNVTCVVECGQQLKASASIELSRANIFEGLDVDLSVPALLATLDVQSIEQVLSVAAAFSSSTAPPSEGTKPQGADLYHSRMSALERIVSGDSTLATLLWLEGQEKVDSSDDGSQQQEIDLQRVARLMRQYQSTKASVVTALTAREDAQYRPLATPSTYAFSQGGGAVVESDSDGEFPASDPESEEEDGSGGEDMTEDSALFFDAVDRKAITRLHMGEKSSHRSAMKESYAAGSSSRFQRSARDSLLFQSALQGSVLSTSGSLAAPPPAVSFKLRIHIAAAEICLSARRKIQKLTVDNLEQHCAESGFEGFQADCELDELCVRVEDAVFLVNHSLAQPAPVDALGVQTGSRVASGSKLTVTLGDVAVVEQSGADRRSGIARPRHKLMADFPSLRHSNVIYAPPKFEAVVQYSPAEEPTTLQGALTEGAKPSKLVVTVTLQPLVASLRLKQVDRWAAVLSSLEVPVAAEESSGVFSLQVSIPQVDLFMHADEAIPPKVWSDLLLALNLRANPDQWSAVASHSRSPFATHLTSAVGGGYKFCFSDIRMSVNAGETAAALQSTQAVEMGRAALAVFVADPDVDSGEKKFWESAVLSASADSEHRCMVRVSRTETKEPGRARSKPKVVLRNKRHLILPGDVAATSELSVEDDSGSEEGEEGFLLVAGSEDDKPGSATGAAGEQHVEELGPRAPSLPLSSIVQISAHQIEIDVRQREYNALMIVADTLSPPTPSVQSATPKVPVKATPFGIGLQLQAKFAKVCLAEKAVAELHIPLFDAFLAQHGISLASDEAQSGDSFFLCVSIREPNIQLRMLHKELFVGLQADDLSMYEMSLDQYEALQTEDFDFNKATDREARFGPNKHRTPFIHRASLHSRLNAAESGGGYEGYKFDSYSTLLGDNKLYGHAFEVRLLLTTKEPVLSALSGGGGTEKAVHFFIDFHDITLSHDPQSTWLLRVVKILTPQTATQMVEFAADEYQRQLLSRYKRLTKEQQQLLDIHELLGAHLNSGDDQTVAQVLPRSASQASMPPLPLDFEKTIIDVRVRDCLIDYCCEGPVDSRCLVTIGLLTVTSTIVSNSPRFSLKFKVSGLALHLSNRLPRSKLPLDNMEQRSREGGASANLSSARRQQELDLDKFFAAHAFVQFLSIDHLDNAIVLNGADLEALAIHVAMGTCCMTACVDSLELFAATLKYWFEEFQVACARSETILQKKRQPADTEEAKGGALGGGQLGSGLDGDAANELAFDKLRFCGEDLQQEDSEHFRYPLDSSAMVDKVVVLQPTKTSAYQRALQDEDEEKVDGGIEAALLEDYYRPGDEQRLSGESHSHYDLEEELEDDGQDHVARWLPQYDYDDDNGGGLEMSGLSSGFELESGGAEVPNEDRDDGGSGVDSSEDESEGDQSLHLPRGQRLQSASFFGLGAAAARVEEEEFELKSLAGAAPLQSDSYDLMNDDLALPGEGARSSFETSNLLDLEDFQAAAAPPAADLITFAEETPRHHIKDDQPGAHLRCSPDDSVTTVSRGAMITNSEAIAGTRRERREMEDVDRAWADRDEDDAEFAGMPLEAMLRTVNLDDEINSAQSSSRPLLGAGTKKLPSSSSAASTGVSGVEQKAQWYSQQGAAMEERLNPHYIPIISSSEDLDDRRPAVERRIATKVLVKMKASFKVRLFEGRDWGLDASSSAAAKHQSLEKHGSAGNATIAPHAPAKNQSRPDQSLSKSVRFAERPQSGPGPNGPKHSTGASHTRPLFAERKKTKPRQNAMPKREVVSARQERDMIELLVRDAFLSIRMYETERDRAAALAEADLLRRIAGAEEPERGNPAQMTGISVPIDETCNPVDIGGDVSAVKDDGTASLWRRHPSLSDPEALAPVAVDLLTGSPLGELVQENKPISQGAAPKSPLSPEEVVELPEQRVMVSAQDLLVSFGKVGQRRRKVLGAWTSLSRPRDMHQPMIQISFVGYDGVVAAVMLGGEHDSSQRKSGAPVDEEHEMEHQLHIKLLPVRLYLNSHFVEFAKQIAAVSVSPTSPAAEQPEPTQSGRGSESGVSGRRSQDLYFRSITVSDTDVKIDYQASTVNLQALHAGDYLQLLNIFPLEGLELTLKHVQFRHVSGLSEWLDRTLEVWVRDIYSNQLHRIVSGTAPFRGIANIGADLHSLFAVPMSEYRKSGGLMSHLQRNTQNLLKTVTKETLNAAHKVTIFVANAISDLAADSPSTAEAQRKLQSTSSSSRDGRQGRKPLPSAEYAASGHSGRGRRRRVSMEHQQPSGVVEGLQRAFSSVSREVGSAVETVIAVPIRQFEQTGPGGYVRSVIRALPIAILRPVAGVAEGISYTMLGLRNDLYPGARFDDEDVWNIEPVAPTDAR